MKGPGIHDYKNKIQELKKGAHEKGELYLEISSKELHEIMSPKHATMPTCCQAMYNLMLQGDEIIEKPKGKSGYGSHLTIRYQVKELINRKPLFPPKKRGRPIKDLVSKQKAGVKKKNWKTEDLPHMIQSWLVKDGWEYSVRENIIFAHKNKKYWIIHIHSEINQELFLSLRMSSHI